jgi:hypothetical protein
MLNAECRNVEGLNAEREAKVLRSSAFSLFSVQPFGSFGIQPFGIFGI